MIAALFLAALLTVTDPPGDAAGNGSLAAPTGGAFRTLEPFDVRRVEVPDANLFSVRLQLGQLPEPGRLPQPILELYLHDEGAHTPGRRALLEGSGMRLPEGRGWHLAFRYADGELRVFAYENGLREVTQEIGARFRLEGDTLVVTTELKTPQRFSLYGLTGSYDPFSETGWRALRDEPSPWGFSSVDQHLPVLDVIADKPELQAQAIARGVLPEIRASFVQEGWLLLAGAGVLVALVGLAARFFTPSPARPPDVPTGPSAPTHPLAPFPPAEVERRKGALRAVGPGEVRLEAAAFPPPPASRAAAPEQEPVNS